ncbi:unnamed protein product [Closterium sp. NIES-53]
MLTRDLSGVRELGTPGVRQATEAALGGVSASASSTSAAATFAAPTPPTTATADSTSTAATEAPTSATTPTPTPSSASTATTASPATSSSSLAPLALADAAPLTRSRRSADRLGANKVDSSSRGNRGQKRNRGAPLKERGAPRGGRQ